MPERRGKGSEEGVRESHGVVRERGVDESVCTTQNKT